MSNSDEHDHGFLSDPPPIAPVRGTYRLPAQGMARGEGFQIRDGDEPLSDPAQATPPETTLSIELLHRALSHVLVHDPADPLQDKPRMYLRAALDELATLREHKRLGDGMRRELYAIIQDLQSDNNTLRARVAHLDADNRYLEQERDGLRARVAELEAQAKGNPADA